MFVQQFYLLTNPQVQHIARKHVFEMTSTFKCAWYFEQQGQEEMGLRDSKEDTHASQQCPLTNNRLIMWRRTKNKIKWEQKKAAPASSDATADIS